MAKRKYKTVTYGDTEYELTPAYRAGAQANRDGVHYHSNPHRRGSRAHDDWNYGYENEDEDLVADEEHNQFFTRVQSNDGKWHWFPMDHFFYAPYRLADTNTGPFSCDVKETKRIVNVAACGGQYVIVGNNDIDTQVWVDTWPQALRVIADIIEKAEKS